MAARSGAILGSGSESQSQSAPDWYVSRLSPLLLQSLCKVKLELNRVVVKTK